jgi:hypothetical protein
MLTAINSQNFWNLCFRVAVAVRTLVPSSIHCLKCLGHERSKSVQPVAGFSVQPHEKTNTWESQHALMSWFADNDRVGCLSSSTRFFTRASANSAMGVACTGYDDTIQNSFSPCTSFFYNRIQSLISSGDGK